MENKYYVYFHRRLDNDEVFYVGKGSGNRAYVQSKRNKYWKSIVNKYGYRIEFYATNLDEATSFMLEVEKISYFRSIRQAYCNLTDGGEGVSGSIRTDNQKKNYSSSKMGDKNPRFGYICTKEEKLRKLELSPTKKDVIQILKDGKKITYPSIRDASRKTGINSSDISRCARGIRKSAGGFRWEFKC